MKINDKEITGVLHSHVSEKNYHLRRYYPSDYFNGFIEQYWLVNWNLEVAKTHNQKNLPDPNFHLIIDKEGVKLLGPVSKIYSYKMEGAGRVIGVKFECGALKKLLPLPVEDYVNKEILAKQIFGSDLEKYLLPLYEIENDSVVISHIQEYLTSFFQPITAQQAAAQSLVSLIKNNEDIFTVKQVASQANMSLRTVQRLFSNYVGLSPKWLIRKYRLSRVLKELENSPVNILDIVTQLEYVDQSHLMRDFKQILGVTLSEYSKLK